MKSHHLSDSQKFSIRTRKGWIGDVIERYNPRSTPSNGACAFESPPCPYLRGTYACVRVIFPVTRTRVHTHALYGMSGYFWLWRQSVTIKTVVSVSQGIYNTENSTDQLEIRVSKHFFRLWKKKRFIRVVNRLFRVTVSSPMSRMRCTKKRVLCYVTIPSVTNRHTYRQTDRQTDTSGPKITFERASLRRYTGSTRTTLVVGSIIQFTLI